MPTSFSGLIFVFLLASLPAWSGASTVNDVGCVHEDVVVTSLLQVSVEHTKMAVAIGSSGTVDLPDIAANASLSVIEDTNMSSPTVAKPALAESETSHTAPWSLEQEYAHIAELIVSPYTKFPDNVNGWTYLAGYEVPGNGFTDGLKVHSKDGVCVISFRGSDDPDDYVNSIKVSYLPAEEKCGSAFHAGFWAELALLIASDQWQLSVAPVLTGGQCNSIYSIGHSLGGALAQMFAACANSQALTEIAATAVTPMTVSKVYTMGAPAMASIGRPLTNAASPDGCFEGARFYNLDSWTYDIVPVVAQPWGLAHGNLRPIQIFSSDDEVISVSYPGTCSSSVAWNEPQVSSLKRTISLGFWSVELPLSPTITDHRVETYRARFRTLWR
mmetsp:Transcript_13811/g.25336  ORF Transcript_13811/g.25336 Transcript_13811/m.25336 type:complete len:386 (+) Transcript_13811:70-1227(+)